jgi:hypothetical protein
VPGTRGTRIGERMEPVLMSKSAPAEGRLESVASERGVYAVATSVRVAHRSDRRRRDAIFVV